MGRSHPATPEERHLRRAPHLAPVLTAGASAIALYLAATGAPIAEPPSGAHHDRAATRSAVVLAAGDIQAPSSTRNPTEALLDAHRHDAVLALGDNQYQAGTLAQYDASYSRTWGEARHKPGTYPVPGNHEHTSRLSANFCRYFRRGRNGRAAVDPCRTSSSRPHYAATIGDWLILGFDTGASGLSGGDLDARSARFLRRTLRHDTHRCQLVFWHHPRYSAGAHRDNQALADQWADMMAAGVDVVLAGHDHNYQRWNRMNAHGRVDRARGIREFVVGTGGRTHYAIARRRAGLQASNDRTYGVLRLALAPRAYRWRFLPATGSRFRDSGSDSCR